MVQIPRARESASRPDVRAVLRIPGYLRHRHARVEVRVHVKRGVVRRNGEECRTNTSEICWLSVEHKERRLPWPVRPSESRTKI